MGARRSETSQEQDLLLTELETIYREVDQRFADWSCAASTECCRFGLTGVEPYVTSIEYLAVVRALQRRGGPLQQKRRALPLAPTREERVCALLDREGRCAVYAARPLGCRTYFCAKAKEGTAVPHREVLLFVRRIQEIAARHTQGGELAHRLGKMLGV